MLSVTHIFFNDTIYLCDLPRSSGINESQAHKEKGLCSHCDEFSFVEKFKKQKNIFVINEDEPKNKSMLKPIGHWWVADLLRRGGLSRPMALSA